MKDLTDPRWIKFKGVLFLIVGLAAALLLLIAIWCFCRAYYFAFYVIEKYVEPGFRFSGLGSAVKYLCRRDAKR